jgi:hypothetical protein
LVVESRYFLAQETGSLTEEVNCRRLSDESGPAKVLNKWWLYGKYALEKGSFDPNSTDMPHHVGMEITSTITETNLVRNSCIEARPLMDK